MSNITSSRTLSFVIIAVIYISAALVGFFTYNWVQSCLASYWALFLADVAATVWVWIFGLLYKNVSVYDPYWSVLPPVMLTIWAVSNESLTLASVLLLIAVWYWGIRLTGNWAYTFRNLDSEDWRYTKYRTEQSPCIFHIINFFGLNMMPTVVVFAALLPGLHLSDSVGGATWLTWAGFVVCIAAATLQWISDNQKHRFAKEHKGEICKIGLWKHGRHPNYLGEIAMWWGVWIMFVSINGLGTCTWFVAGPIAMTCLFLFISIPLMEKRQLKNKPGYAEYKKATRMFV
ncbi:MAG: DUF1295 domain-containing protein [Bacteroidales bacterium]|nr:DUF1295 domain-containing protein [Bacteroidales bacterium]